MNFNWNQKAFRAVHRLIRSDALDADRVSVVKRSLYFNQFKIAIHASPTVSNWVDYHEVSATLSTHLRGFEHRLVSSSSALYFNVYTNDTQVLDAMGEILEDIELHSISVIHPRWHNNVQPRVRNKGQFYHKYAYRLRASSPDVWDPEQYSYLLTGDWHIGGPFLYCTNVRDIILLKLVHEGTILEISER